MLQRRHPPGSNLSAPDHPPCPVLRAASVSLCKDRGDGRLGTGYCQGKSSVVRVRMKHRSIWMQLRHADRGALAAVPAPALPADTARTAFGAEFLDFPLHSCSLEARKTGERGQKASQTILDISHLHTEFRPVTQNRLLCSPAVHMHPTFFWPVPTQIPDWCFKKTKSVFFPENQILATWLFLRKAPTNPPNRLSKKPHRLD